jgi:hypothetical protein
MWMSLARCSIAPAMKPLTMCDAAARSSWLTSALSSIDGARRAS